MTYVKTSYELLLSAEGRALVNLDSEIEAWVVHSLARHFENPHIPEDAVAISLMKALQMCGEERKNALQKVGEECMLIDGFNWNHHKWPSKNYYIEMGQLALSYRTHSSRPPDLFYDKIAMNLPVISKVLHNLNSP